MEGLNPSEWRQTRNRSEDRSEMGGMGRDERG